VRRVLDFMIVGTVDVKMAFGHSGMPCRLS
jgi:hypothetical protein